MASNPRRGHRSPDSTERDGKPGLSHLPAILFKHAFGNFRVSYPYPLACLPGIGTSVLGFCAEGGQPNAFTALLSPDEEGMAGQGPCLQHLRCERHVWLARSVHVADCQASAISHQVHISRSLSLLGRAGHAGTTSVVGLPLCRGSSERDMHALPRRAPAGDRKSESP